MIATGSGKALDSYLHLVRRFPLRAIRTEGAHNAAVQMVIALSGRDSELDQGEVEYLSALAVLVGEYERERYAIKSRKIAPLPLLKFLMRENGLGVGDLARILGSQSAASMLLNGRRAISKEAARKLASHFGLEIGAFIV